MPARIALAANYSGVLPNLWSAQLKHTVISIHIESYDTGLWHSQMYSAVVLCFPPKGARGKKGAADIGARPPGVRGMDSGPTSDEAVRRTWALKE